VYSTTRDQFRGWPSVGFLKIIPNSAITGEAHAAMKTCVLNHSTV
jgi:hypothetical protein